MGWAVSHPNAPGLMPWPDRNADGNHDGDSDCASLSSGATFNPAFLLGRLPWRGRTNPCERTHGGLCIDVRDGAGERLWYAVSRNLIRRYQSPAGYPAINPRLADTAPYPWITVRDGNHALLSDRVAVVILAPGMALNGQDRAGTAPNARDYLDTHGETGVDNADSDGCFDDNPGCGGIDGEEFVLAKGDATFNDRLAFITIDELMTNIERRVLNEVDKVLDRRREVGGAYSWPSPFAYPTALVSGSVTENGATYRDLVDDKADFLTADVRPGQVIRNISDGSKGIIETVRRAGLSLTTDGLRHGKDNRFRINRVNDPSDNDRYEILVDASGVATDAGGNRLRDTDRAVDFGALGIRIGDLVENVSDETYGVVTGIPDPATLMLRRLASDDSMGFDPGDSYEVPRFNGVPNTREGALPLHGAGERFRTGFGVAWNISGGVVEITPSVNNDPYRLALERALRCAGMGDLTMPPELENENCRSNHPPVTIPWRDGSCSWRSMESVRCEGRADWGWYPAGTVTETHGSGPIRIEDGNRDFRERGVDTGDIILNTSDGSRGVITSLGDRQLEVARLCGGARNDFRIGDGYRIRVATRILPEGTADCADISHGGHAISCDSTTLVDTDTNFRANGARPGDTIGNRDTGWWGIIREVGLAGAPAHGESLLRVEDMGEDSAGFAFGDRYVIRSEFADKRRHAFHLDFIGNGGFDGDTGLRRVWTRTDTPLAAQNRIRIQDWDDVNDRIVMDAVIAVGSPGATKTAGIRISGIQLDLAPDDFPAWFSAHWREFIYMAASRAYLPLGNGDCKLNDDCLVLRTVGLGGTVSRSDIEALILSGGPKTNGVDCLQIRPGASPDQYLEEENARPDDGSGFQRRHPRRLDACFRDQARIVAP